MSHRARPVHVDREPVLVTVRVVDGLPSLRRPDLAAAVQGALAAASRETFRVIHYSILRDHMHLIVEAENRESRARGMQGLGVRAARAVNRILGRRGGVWDDRHHTRALKTPLEVRNAIVYVIQNARKHRVATARVDPMSSGPWFDGWAFPVAARAGSPPVSSARTWLLSKGWKHWGLIGAHEAPVAYRSM